MDPLLFIAVSLLVPTIVAELALRYGADSRPPYRSHEHTLALGGMTWDDLPARTPTPSREPRIQLVRGGEPGTYPTLTMIDRTREPEATPFATDPHAARLEDRARQLVDEYWSDAVWLTGLVPATACHAVCSALERERLTEAHPVVLLVDMEITEPGATIPTTPCKPELADAEIAVLSAGVG